jgi:hypothetical protein
MMKADEARDYWRWRMFRLVAEYIHDPDDTNRMELINLLDAYRQELAMQDSLNVQECSANAM